MTVTDTEDLARWAKARSLADLADLTADWLGGDLPTHPGWAGEPDEETAEIGEHLIALNRAGWLTIDSQPGHNPDADGYVQRHAVKFILGREQAFGLLLAAMYDSMPTSRMTPLMPGHDEHVAPLPLDVSGIKTEYGIEEVTCRFGCGPDEEWALLFGESADDLTPELREALADAWILAVAAPHWGRHDRGLWTWLRETTTQLNRS